MASDANVGIVTTVEVGRMLDDGKWGAYQKMLIALTALAIDFPSARPSCGVRQAYWPSGLLPPALAHSRR